MDDLSIDAFKWRLMTGPRTLYWMDSDQKTHLVVGFDPAFDELDDGEPEPVARLEGGKCVALRNTELREFYTLTRAFGS